MTGGRNGLLLDRSATTRLHTPAFLGRRNLVLGAARERVSARTIRLTPFRKRHVDTLIEWLPSARELLEWGGPLFTHPLDLHQLERHWRRQRRGTERRLYTVLEAGRRGEAGRETPIGHVELCDIHPVNRSARLCRVLVGPREHRGCGWGTAIVRAALEIAFDELQLHRVSLGVFDFNTPAIRCYERAGFRREGLLRDARRFETEYWSVVAMSLLEDEWRRTALGQVRGVASGEQTQPR
jgi:RimJ/RimL family protein N-acetyltransferase